MALSPDDPVVAIDPKLATRRMGRSKGPEAHVVLADALGIETVGQLLHHYPRRYIDRSLVLPIGQLKIDAFATVIATVRSVKKRQTRRRQTMVTVTIGDGTGFLDLTFFNQPWTASLYREGVEVAVSGIVQLYRHRLQLGSQEIEVLRGDDQDLVHTGRITPVHPAPRASARARSASSCGAPSSSCRRSPTRCRPRSSAAEALADGDEAMRCDPLPRRTTELATARERLKFDELFTLELGVGFRSTRLEAERDGVAHDTAATARRAFAAALPFTPTDAQRRAIERGRRARWRRRADEPAPAGRRRVGQDARAVHACLVAIGSGHQAAIMAPTEVLAGQHLRSATALLEPIGAVPFLAAPRPSRRDQASCSRSAAGSRATPSIPTRC